MSAEPITLPLISSEAYSHPSQLQERILEQLCHHNSLIVVFSTDIAVEAVGESSLSTSTLSSNLTMSCKMPFVPCLKSSTSLQSSLTSFAPCVQSKEWFRCSSVSQGRTALGHAPSEFQSPYCGDVPPVPRWPQGPLPSSSWAYLTPKK